MKINLGANLTGGAADFSKARPILFVMSDKNYRKLGEQFAMEWNIGNELKNS